jgi:hypothetical protein
VVERRHQLAAMLRGWRSWMVLVPLPNCLLEVLPQEPQLRTRLAENSVEILHQMTLLVKILRQTRLLVENSMEILHRTRLLAEALVLGRLMRLVEVLLLERPMIELEGLVQVVRNRVRSRSERCRLLFLHLFHRFARVVPCSWVA